MNEKINLAGSALFDGVIIESKGFKAIARRLEDGSIKTTLYGPNKQDTDSETTSPWISLSALFFACNTVVIFPAIGFLTVGKYSHNLLAIGLVQPALTLLMFVTSIALARLNPTLKQFFQYHGAEHQSIQAADNQLPLTPEEASRFPTAHRRCGTGMGALFLATNFLSPVFCWTCALILGHDQDPATVMVIQVVSLMLVMTLSIWLFYLSIKEPRASFLTIPGLWLQKLTTAKPDRDQLAVALAAVRAVIEAEEAVPVL